MNPSRRHWLAGASALAAGARLGGAGLALAAAAPARAATVVLRDDRGAEHRFDATPRRIVSMMPSLTEMVGALGAADRLVGVDRYSNWPAAVQRLPRLGGLDDARLEAIVALQPDVVLASLSARVLDRLDALGLRVLRLRSDGLADVQRSLDTLARLLGDAEAGGRLWRQLEQALAAAAQRVPPGLRGRTVYFELGGGPYAAGSSSFVGELLARLGLSNIVPPALGPFPKLNPEFIVRARPEIVMGLAREQAALAARPGWGALPALRDGRRCGFSSADYELLTRPGPWLGDAADVIARCLEGLAR
ncbi:ABC transporter substrate-binding protein [Piscinibacter sakaiensis]|uniref:Vitamin B12 ABC transporter, B12-binding component BtuF n=1 Tax=Piscinibacter sakaiensis TaxID=1547922 RepID=A0A0K8NZ18_PISS1|nr:helical backbone metal receptor [Piscinibacter sakaiensis]GAP35647.1 vitamin B12 ABC transporter, B12-binding component BtuF [Piscinibacter sakaiensis]